MVCWPQAYYGSAMEYMDSLLSLDNLSSIQCVLCCALFSIRSPVGVNVWYSLSLHFRRLMIKTKESSKQENCRYGSSSLYRNGIASAHGGILQKRQYFATRAVEAVFLGGAQL